MRQYSELHDTGDDKPCERGWCCARDRELMEAVSVLAKYRKSPPDSVSEDAFLAAMKGNDSTPPAVLEFLHLLDHPWRYLRLSDFCILVGIPHARLMQYRVKYSDLEGVCRLYLSALAEDEFESGKRKMSPTVLGMALERLVPAFAKVPDESLTDEDISVIVRTVVDGIRVHITALDLPEEKQSAFIHGVAASVAAAFALRIAGD